MAQLHIRLSDDQKAEWKEYAAEEGYGNLSRFVRMAVENERDDEEALSTRGEPVTVPENIATSEDLDQLNDTLLRVVDRLDELDGRVRQVERERVRPNDERAVLEALPRERPSADQTDDFEKHGDPDLETPDVGTAFDGRPESIGRVADESVSAVEYFLAQAAQRSDEIEAAQIGGELRYWKVNPDE